LSVQEGKKIFIKKSLVSIGAFSFGWRHQPGLKILATAGFDPKTFSPGSFLQPGLKVPNESGIKVSGHATEKSRWIWSISLDLKYNRN
jgi:hypothetical protein